jgi:hypothetical protein
LLDAGRKWAAAHRLCGATGSERLATEIDADVVPTSAVIVRVSDV